MVGLMISGFVRHTRFLEEESSGWPFNVPWDSSWPALPELSGVEGLSVDMAQDVYALAATNPEPLQYVSCYCGCRLQGHHSVFHCYVKRHSADRRIIEWESHGRICPVGTAITGDATAWHQRGMPLAEIQAEIDREFSSGPADVVAASVAAVVLVTVVLPAEYGLDPLGTGRALGLTAFTEPVAAAPTSPLPEGAIKLIPVQNGPAAVYPGEFKVDSRELVLGPYEYIEFKYHLEQGAAMVFSWKASADVAHDFHGDAEGAAADATQSYDKQPRRRADGSFLAPFAGIHGWFWENPGGEPITISLTTAGFYTSAHEFHSDRTRRQLDVGGLERIAVARDQKESVQ